MRESPNPEGLDRRTVIKAGVWAVPAVVLATATPAAAASLEKGQLQFTHVAGWIEGTPPGIAGSTTVQIKWSATAQVVNTLTVEFALEKAGMAVAPIQIVSGPGWSPAGTTEDDTKVYYRVNWAGTLDPAQAGMTSELKAVLPGDGLDGTDFPKVAAATVASSQANGETRSGTLQNTASVENPIIIVVRDPETPP